MVHIHEGRFHGFLEVQIEHDSDRVLLDWSVKVVVLVVPEGLIPNRLGFGPALDLLVVLAKSNACVFVPNKNIVFLAERGEIVVHGFRFFDFFYIRSIKE